MKYTVAELYIYPIKSLAGISVESAKAEEMGFENDRRWMLIDDNNQFITQRKHPVLSQFYPKIDNGQIRITYQDKHHEFRIEENIGFSILSNVWDDSSEVVEVSTISSNWFTAILGFTCKLVKIRNAGDRKHTSRRLNVDFNVSLADGYPYLVIGTESLSFLNEKLEEKVSISRFRPNIVVRTNIAHEEDDFEIFTINAVGFKNVKPCGRCIMVNNDPLTGKVKKEPLKTLSTYRSVNNSVLFGTNLICVNSGVVNVGDILVF